jgi:hypothetical protein
VLVAVDVPVVQMAVLVAVPVDETVVKSIVIAVFHDHPPVLPPAPPAPLLQLRVMGPPRDTELAVLAAVLEPL